MDASQILTRDEIRTVVLDLYKRRKRGINAWQNLVIFRLSTCCGLRRKEIAGLNLDDFVVEGPRPCIRVRRITTKGTEVSRRARKVPLWWDSGTLKDLADWLQARKNLGAKPGDPYVCSLSKKYRFQRMTGQQAARRWITSVQYALGPERTKQLHIHCGRHSFCSHALLAGHTIVEVRDAAGHRNIATTSIYLHAVAHDVPDIFAF